MEHITNFFLSFIDRFGYAGLFVVMLLGNMGVPVGTELVMPAAGALTATGHLANIWATILVATVGEVAGGLILYTIGWYGGKPFVLRYGKYIKLTEKKFDQWEVFYQRHGNVIIFACRFLPLFRGFAALPAGVLRMQKRYFITYTALGSLIFCTILAYIGEAMGTHKEQMMGTVHRFGLLFLALAILAIIAFVLRKYLMDRRRPA